MENEVLIIEDESSLSELVRINLTLRGISAVVANNGEEGLQLAHEMRPRLILLDVRLPDIDGWEICRALKRGKIEWKPRIVFLTAATQRSDREKAREAGGDGFLEKPFEIPELIKTVRKFLE